MCGCSEMMTGGGPKAKTKQTSKPTYKELIAYLKRLQAKKT